MMLQRHVITKTDTATLTLAEMGDIFANSVNAQTYKTPTASKGLWYRIGNINTGLVTITNPADATLATLAQYEQCLVLNDGTTWYVSNHAGETAAQYKSADSSFTDNDTAQTFIDAFCTSTSLVIVSITGATPAGIWSVVSEAGQFTITSTETESTDITFDYYIIKG